MNISSFKSYFLHNHNKGPGVRAQNGFSMNFQETWVSVQQSAVERFCWTCYIFICLLPLNSEGHKLLTINLPSLLRPNPSSEVISFCWFFFVVTGYAVGISFTHLFEKNISYSSNDFNDIYIVLQCHLVFPSWFHFSPLVKNANNRPDLCLSHKWTCNIPYFQTDDVN